MMNKPPLEAEVINWTTVQCIAWLEKECGFDATIVEIKDDPEAWQDRVLDEIEKRGFYQKHEDVSN